MDKVGQYIKETRMEKNLSLEEMSKETLISIAILKDIESGNLKNYKGDEVYIKMYLKKIATFLQLDPSTTKRLQEDFDTLLNNEKQPDTSQEEPTAKGSNKGYYIKNMIKEATTPSTLSTRKRETVYQDHVMARYVKGGIIVILCAVIICIVWYSLVVSKMSNTGSYKEPGSADVEENQKQTEAKKAKKEKEKTQKEEEKQPEIPPMNITQINGSSYNFPLKAGENFRLEVTFGATSTFNLFEGKQPIEGVYRVYNANETYTYEAPVKGNEAFTLNLWNMENVIIKINGTPLAYDRSTIKVIDGVSRVTLYMKGQ